MDHRIGEHAGIKWFYLVTGGSTPLFSPILVFASTYTLWLN